MATVFVGDIGTVFEITVKDDGTVVDISGATTTKNILMLDPAGTLNTKTGEFTTNGTDGKVDYTTVSGDLDMSGTWRIQAYLKGASYDLHTSIGTFEVKDILA